MRNQALTTAVPPLLLSLLALFAPPLSAADDTDALALESAPVAAKPTRDGSMKLFVEGAIGRIERRHGLPSETASRLSLDYSQTFTLSPRWQLSVSDRIDHVDPAEIGSDATLNSLRELFARWRDESQSTIVEFGRVNVRQGSGYGYNATDYFRDTAVRAATTVDPFALRENRLGTVMVRAQRLFGDGSASIVVAPKLADAPSGETFSLDLGATNRRSRVMAALSRRFSDRMSADLSVYADDDKRTQLGISGTALLSDAIVLHAEATRGRDDDLLAAVTGARDPKVTRSRVAAGLTLSAPGQLSLTAEYEYNGFATDISAFAARSPANVPLALRYLLESDFRQDNAARRAWLVYATQRDLFVKRLDVTALVRVNADDRSRLAWVELRRRWDGFDGALQWQHSSGKTLSQYSLPPTRQTLQLLATVYF